MLARFDLDEAIQIDPTDPRAYEHRGRLHEANGELELAARDFADAKRLEQEELESRSLKENSLPTLTPPN